MTLLMRVIQGLQEVETWIQSGNLPSPWPHGVIAMGNYDGLHLGHQKILQDAVKTAKAYSGTSICLTFEPHPLKVLCPDSPPKLLQTLEQKVECIASQGLEVLIVQPFDLEFSRLEYNVFFEDVLCRILQPKAIRVGCRFAFGHQRKGDGEKLSLLCQKLHIDFKKLPEFRLGEEGVSSSKIRGLIGKGKLSQANALLGRPYEIRGVVHPGAGRGEKIGFPTANIAFENDALIPYGVYACRFYQDSSNLVLEGVANFGVRPTFSTERVNAPREVFEIHLFDFEKDLYDQRVRVEILDYLRSEKCFSNSSVLQDQIRLDCEKARQILRASPKAFSQ